MEYNLSLRLVGVLAALWLLFAHGLALWRPDAVRRWAATLPRSQMLGTVLLTIDLIWTFVLAYRMDWGEFYNLRPWVLVLLPVAYFVTLRYVNEFLASRGLGILLLLAAAPLLDAAFLKPQNSRLLVVILAYAWVILGMFWVGRPHLLRDHIAWFSESTSRWRAAAGGGVIYGLAVLVCALLWY